MKKMSKKLKSKWSIKAPLYLTKKDKRYSKYKKQLKSNGFSDTETWELDSVISEFILPRLIRFKEINCGFPCNLTSETWDETLDKIIFSFHWNLNSDVRDLSKEQTAEMWERYAAGMQLFAKYFRDLWW